MLSISLFSPQATDKYPLRGLGGGELRYIWDMIVEKGLMPKYPKGGEKRDKDWGGDDKGELYRVERRGETLLLIHEIGLDNKR